MTNEQQTMNINHKMSNRTIKLHMPPIEFEKDAFECERCEWIEMHIDEIEWNKDWIMS